MFLSPELTHLLSVSYSPSITSKNRNMHNSAGLKLHGVSLVFSPNQRMGTPGISRIGAPLTEWRGPGWYDLFLSKAGSMFTSSLHIEILVVGHPQREQCLSSGVCALEKLVVNENI